MNTPRHVQDLLDDIVGGRHDLRLPLHGPEGTRLGELRPITRADLDHPELIQALTDWRNANMHAFFGQFVATPERTRNWMARDLLATPGKLLCMIHVDGQMVGHYGFKNLDADEVLLDNAMLGVRCARPGVMREAGRALICWLFAHTPVQRIWGEVLTNNAPALMMNRELGFVTARKLPMYAHEADGQVTWVMGEEGDERPTRVHCHKLVLTREHWSRQPWAEPSHRPVAQLA